MQEQKKIKERKQEKTKTTHYLHEGKHKPIRVPLVLSSCAFLAVPELQTPNYIWRFGVGESE